MKKIAILILAVAMALSMVACSNENEDKSNNNEFEEFPEFAYLQLLETGGRIYINSYKIEGTIIYVDGYTAGRQGTDEEGNSIVPPDKDQVFKYNVELMTDISNVILYKHGEREIVQEEDTIKR